MLFFSTLVHASKSGCDVPKEPKQKLGQPESKKADSNQTDNTTKKVVKSGKVQVNNDASGYAAKLEVKAEKVETEKETGEPVAKLSVSASAGISNQGKDDKNKPEPEFEGSAEYTRTTENGNFCNVQ
ncbi:hypothetical protein AGMMS49936_10040 [Endomicrobiia bacterium]|nr:hypothetical protein AGMMS49936_10040 [Endomicrobiia bacterium]